MTKEKDHYQILSSPENEENVGINTHNFSDKKRKFRQNLHFKRHPLGHH